jgi:hypothetical protein
MDRIEQRYVTKCLFFGGKWHKVIQMKPSRVLKEDVVVVDVCKSWFHGLKTGNVSMDD